MAPLTMWDEKNTGTNLPAQIEMYATDGDAYKFLFMAKGGGSANKSYLFQETKALLNPTADALLDEKLRTLGTAACPPYHLAVVIGGTSAEYALKTAKYASARYLDTLPTDRQRARPRLSRRRARAGGAELTRTSASAPSSAASTSATTCAWSGSHGTAHPVPVAIAVAARPIARRSARSPPTASSSSSSSATRRSTSPKPPMGTWPAWAPTPSCGSTSPDRWTRSAPTSPAVRWVTV